MEIKTTSELRKDILIEKLEKEANGKDRLGEIG